MIKSNPALLSDVQDTIIALCTSQGKGPIALIRLSGNNVTDIVDRFAQLSSGKKLDDQVTHTIHYGHIVDPTYPGKIIDEVLFFLMLGPKTFTGQNTIEISCHNNPYIIEKIISCAISQGTRLARRGEFSKRAFLNGKIDLVQAESIHEIISAPSELSLHKAMSQLQGSLSNYLNTIENDIISLIGLVESSFEFLEEEQQDLDFDKKVKETLQNLISKINEVKANFNQQQQIKQGFRIAIIGSVNAGKSTLFNSLLNKNRAIVSNIEGTTRDSIEATLYKNGNFWSLIDTAGLREAENIIEQQGIERSNQEAVSADIILLVLDASNSLQDQERTIYKELLKKYKNKIIVVHNKSDKISRNQIPSLKIPLEIKSLKVSAKNKSGLKQLDSEIESKISYLFSNLQSPFLLNQRQFNVISEIESKLNFIANSYSNEICYELIAYQLKDLLEKTAELTGKNITEGVLDSVFSTFCVGK